MSSAGDDHVDILPRLKFKDLTIERHEAETRCHLFRIETLRREPRFLGSVYCKPGIRFSVCRRFKTFEDAAYWLECEAQQRETET